MTAQPTKAQRGKQAEDLACAYLQARSLRLIARNYACSHGEIDIIMADGAYVVFIEVRYREAGNYVRGAESVDARKRARLIATALYYLQRNAEHRRRPARFDVVDIAAAHSVTWIKDAFQA